MAVFDLFLGRVSGDKRVDVVGQAITASVSGANVIATVDGEWSVVGSSFITTFTGTTWTPIEPPGVASGDLFIACIASRFGPFPFSVTAPSGWGTVSGVGGGGAEGSIYMAHLIRGSSTPAMTFTFDNNIVSIGQVWVYRGARPIYPVVDAATSAFTLTTTAISVLGITTTLPNDLIVAAISGGGAATYTNFNATNPSGASGVDDSVNPPSSTWARRLGFSTLTASDAALAVFDAVKATTGATGNFTATSDISVIHGVAVGAFRLNAITSISVTAGGQALAVSVGSVTVATGVGINISVGTLASTASVGAVAVLTVQNLTHLVSGVVMTSAVGSVSVSTPSGVNVTTNLMTSAVGTVTVGNVSNLGVAVSTNLMASAVGAATVAFGSSISVTTNVMTVAVGGVSVTAGGTVSIFVAGNSLTANVGTVAVAAVTTVPVTGLGLAASVGAVSVSVGAAALISGLQISTAVQGVSLRFASNLPVDGLLMNARAGNIYSTNWGTSDSLTEVWTTVPHH